MSKAKDILNDLLVTVFNYITNIEAVSLKQMGVELSMNEVHILEAIKDTDVPIMTNVASKLLITTGTLTTAINTLVQKGYVERYQEENDRRKVLLKLTSKGDDVIHLHDVFHNEMIENAIKDMNISEDSDLIPMLENLSTYFHNMYLKRCQKKQG